MLVNVFNHAKIGWRELLFQGMWNVNLVTQTEGVDQLANTNLLEIDLSVAIFVEHVDKPVQLVLTQRCVYCLNEQTSSV